MESLSSIFSKIFLRAAVICIILSVIARIQNFQVNGKAVLPWFMGISADALLRFTDTCLLFAIALALIQLVGSKEKKSSETKSE
ncbi:MAG: hypothetical protein ACE14V_00210 [bacterium]